MPYLKPLADPILEAFAQAQRDSSAGRTAMAGPRARCAQPVRGFMDGVTFWGLFASYLDELLAAAPSVARDTESHVLTYAWVIADRLRLQLKSEPSALDSEQLPLPGLDGVEPGDRHLVALSWGHRGVERFAPAFVHVTSKGDQWRQPVAGLIDLPSAGISQPAERPRLSSKRGEAERRANNESNE